MKRIVLHAIVLAFAATHALAGVVPAPKAFHAGKEQTDARMIYVGKSESGGLLAVDNHANFMLARDDNNVALNWCNAGTFKWSFGFYGCDGPKSGYPRFEADRNGSAGLTFDGGDKLRMILEPGFGYALPESITDGKLSVELWVVNPSVEKNEVLVSFEDKPGYKLTCEQFKIKGGKAWQHLVAVSDGAKVTFYRDGKLVGRRQGALRFSGGAIINLGAESLSGSIAAFRIHTEAMNTADITHNFKGGPQLGTYLFYAVSAKEPTHAYWGDPSQCKDLSWHESEHFRSMWKEKDNPRPKDDIGARIKNKQLKDLETVYKYLNEKSGKHLPFVSKNDKIRGDGRKYKWLVGNGYGGSWMGSSPLGLGYGI